MSKKNNLAICYPNIASQWHPEKNTYLTPETVGAQSHKSVWWLCDQGHEFQARIDHRTKIGTGCPYCSNKRIIIGANDLVTRFPKVFAQWHPEKNGELKPETLKTNYPEKVWWLCDQGHEFQARINERIYTGQGCPYCAGKKILKGFNDLATLAPEIAVFWHPTKNNKLTPSQVTVGSMKKVWWRCNLGHEYARIIKDQVNRSLDCPYCSGKRVLPGYNDLTTRYPKIAAEWHPTKNRELRPEGVSAGSKRRIWWICPKGHEYATSITCRTSKSALQSSGNGCPYCANQKLLKGFNDIETADPDLAVEWHPEFNGSITPRDVISGSSKKYWWKCMEGHSWYTSPNKRKAGNNCPVCAYTERTKHRKTTIEKTQAKYLDILQEAQKHS